MTAPQPDRNTVDRNTVDRNTVDRNTVDRNKDATAAPAGVLVVVATPIGNLGDLSPRAEQALREADAIACEDTRHTRKLLSARSITSKRLLAVHEHNEVEAAAGIVGLVARGQTVALVTDAGTPGISDPGQRVVAAVADAGLAVTCVPGPAALIVALALSGLSTARFVFDGFLPRKGRERAGRLQDLVAERRTTVLYESPQRVSATMADLAEVLGGERRVAVCRELTKHFESVWRGRLADAGAAAIVTAGRGEYVLVIAGAPEPEGTVDEDDLGAMLDARLAGGASVRDAVQAVETATGAPHRIVYGLAVERARRPRSAR